MTGGSGFIGCNLIKELKDKGFNILSIDDYSSGLKENEISGVRYIELDINDIDQIDFNADVCFHLAAKSRVQPSFLNPTNYFDQKGTYSV